MILTVVSEENANISIGTEPFQTQKIRNCARLAFLRILRERQSDTA